VSVTNNTQYHLPIGMSCDMMQPESNRCSGGKGVRRFFVTLLPTDKYGKESCDTNVK